MLTWSDLEVLCEARKLTRWKGPPVPRGLKPRFLYLTSEVHDQIANRPWPSADGERPDRTALRRTAMRAVLHRFSQGHMLNVNRDMKELGSRDVNAQMRGFWEFRSQGPIHETRLFGFFARRGAFVGLRFGSRDGMQDADFETELGHCNQIWQELFSDAEPLSEPWPVLARPDLEEYLNERA